MGDLAHGRDDSLPSLLAGFDRQLPRWLTVRTIFFLLLLVSLCVDLGFGFAYKFRLSPDQLDADELEYYKMAGQMMGGTLHLTARRTLGFPLLIATVRSINDNFLFLQAVICALFSFSAPLLFLVVRKVTRSTAAAGWSGLALALWPPVIYYGVSLYSEALALPVFLLALWALPVGSRADSTAKGIRWKQAAVAGLVLAIATQVRPMYLIMTPFIAIIIAIEEADLRVAFRRLLVVALAYVAVTLPWSIYMTERFHHPILVTSNGGETLSGGLNPKLLEPWAERRKLVGGRDVWVGPGKWLTPHQNGYLSGAELALPYDQQDALMRERTMAWVKANPGAAFQLEACKVFYMWGIYHLSKNGPAQLLFGNLPTLALLAIALFAFIRVPEARTALPRLWVLPFFVSAVALISWGSWRFRQPGDAGLVAFCAVCVLLYLAKRRATDGIAARELALSA